MKALRVLLGCVVVGFALYGASQLVREDDPVVDVYYLSDFTTGPDGVVGFPSWNASTAKEVMSGGANSVHQSSGGLLVLPPAASASDPVPAVVILHGSGGDWSGRSVYLANRLAKSGIAGFAVDTFVARNLRPTDDYFVRLQKASIYTQIIAGLMALKALQDHPATAPQRRQFVEGEYEQAAIRTQNGDGVAAQRLGDMQFVVLCNIDDLLPGPCLGDHVALIGTETATPSSSTGSGRLSPRATDISEPSSTLTTSERATRLTAALRSGAASKQRTASTFRSDASKKNSMTCCSKRWTSIVAVYHRNLSLTAGRRSLRS